MKIKPTPPNPKLDALIERAKDHKITPVEIDEQRRSWVRGNMMLDNPEMTAEQVNAALGPSLAEQLAAARSAALEEAASIHDDRVKDLQQNLRFVRSADQESSIKHAITIHEDSASAIRALKGEG